MKKFFVLAPAALILFACGGETNEEVDNLDENIEEIVEDQVSDPVDEENIDMPTPVSTHLSSDADIQAFLSEESWKSTEPDANGMYVVIDEAGEGDARPALTDEVTIYYQGYLLDGTRFDGTEETPLTYPLNGFIEGWQLGIPQFGKGGKGKLIIPSDLAYGDQAVGDIPAGSTLLFEIELVDWTPAR